MGTWLVNIAPMFVGRRAPSTDPCDASRTRPLGKSSPTPTLPKSPTKFRLARLNCYPVCSAWHAAAHWFGRATNSRPFLLLVISGGTSYDTPFARAFDESRRTVRGADRRQLH